MALKERAICFDASGDDPFASVHENWLAFLAVRVQQRLASPAFQRSGQLPSQVRYVLKTRIQTECSIGRVTVGSVARDERTSLPIRTGNRDAQVPEPNMVNCARKREASGSLQQSVKVVVFRSGILRHGCVKEPSDLLNIASGGYLPVHQGLISSLVLRLREDTKAEGSMLDSLDPLLHPSGKSTIPRAVAAARGVSPDLAAWCRDELERQMDPANPPQLGFDLLSQEVRAVAFSLLNAIEGGENA